MLKVIRQKSDGTQHDQSASEQEHLVRGISAPSVIQKIQPNFCKNPHSALPVDEINLHCFVQHTEDLF